jgi:hypothetical protein|tara:strand:+ start:712 stop:990 length:279 start_codon:yes stop_codon:yes gene_type:complete
MALTERIENDKIEVVGKYKTVQVRQATVIEKDGVEVARSFHRKSFQPGTLNDSDALVDTDLSGEDADVAAIATAVWTDEIKEAYRLMLVATK